MVIRVYSKKVFDNIMVTNAINDSNIEDRKDVFLISIVDTDQFSKSRIPYFKEDHENVMNLAFDDCEHDGEPSPTQPYGTKAFTEKQAKDLYEFIKRNINKDLCIVHCMAGLSRSPGVGQFIVDFTKSDQNIFKRNNHYMMPNARVYRMLKYEWINDLLNG